MSVRIKRSHLEKILVLASVLEYHDARGRGANYDQAYNELTDLMVKGEEMQPEWIEDSSLGDDLSPSVRKYKLVHIEWLDSHQSSGWTTDDPPIAGLLCKSVGWLVQDGILAKTLASSMTDEDMPQRCGHMTIPTCCIQSIKALVENT